MSFEAMYESPHLKGINFSSTVKEEINKTKHENGSAELAYLLKISLYMIFKRMVIVKDIREVL